VTLRVWGTTITVDNIMVMNYADITINDAFTTEIRDYEATYTIDPTVEF